MRGYGRATSLAPLRFVGSANGLEQQGGVFAKIMVVALARKLLIALWRFVIDGVLPEGAVFKPAA